MRVLVTGAAGVAGRAVVALLRQRSGLLLRLVDVMPPATRDAGTEWLRCDLRSAHDADVAVRGCGAVIHLAAWHCGHVPPVSDDTIFATNVDGSYHVVQAARRHGVRAFVYGSSMAFGHGDVYALTKVIGEDLVRHFHESTGMPAVSLRYHDFVPKPYLAFGAKLLANGVDVRDVAAATVAALDAALARRVRLFTTIVHHQIDAPTEVVSAFDRLGASWLDAQQTDAVALLRSHGIALPPAVEQHDLSAAAQQLGWRPRVNIVDFVRDLQARTARGDDVHSLWAPGRLPEHDT